MGEITSGLPMKRWSYSKPTDQFGTKAYSMPAPTVAPQRVFPRRIEPDERRQRRIRRVPVVRDSAAALHVEQRTVPGIADLTGEQAEALNLGLVSLAGKLQAGIAALEISPVALRFQTEDPGRHLPAIADLSTDRAARGIVAAFVSEAIRIPVEAAGTAAAVDTDVETAPVIGGLNDRRRLCIRREREYPRQRPRLSGRAKRWQWLEKLCLNVTHDFFPRAQEKEIWMKT